MKPKPPAVPPADEVQIDPTLLSVRFRGAALNGHPHHINHFERLPEKTVSRIFGFLNTNSLCRAASVCRRFYFLAWEPSLWKTVTLTPSATATADRGLISLLGLVFTSSPAASIERLVLNGCGSLTDAGLRTAARSCPDLRRLEMRGCQLVTNVGVQEVAGACHALGHLELSGE